MHLQSNELNFESQNIYIGIDVHLKSWSVSILTDNLHHKTFNQASDVCLLVSFHETIFGCLTVKFLIAWYRSSVHFNLIALNSGSTSLW